MKHKCSKCGHVDEIKPRAQIKGGRSRWAGMTQEQRSAEMRRVANIKHAANKDGAAPGPSNTVVRDAHTKTK